MQSMQRCVSEVMVNDHGQEPVVAQMPCGCILFLMSDSSQSCQVTQIDRYQLCQCKSNLNHEDILFVRFNIVAPVLLPKPCL